MGKLATGGRLSDESSSLTHWHTNNTRITQQFGLPMPGPLKRAKREAWDEKLSRALQELAWDTAANYPYSGVTSATKK